MDYPAGGIDQSPQFREAQHIYARPVFLQRLEERDGIDVSGGGEGFLEHHYEAHLISKDQPPADGVRRCGELFLHHPAAGVVRAAAVGDHRPDAVES